MPAQIPVVEFFFVNIRVGVFDVNRGMDDLGAIFHPGAFSIRPDCGWRCGVLVPRLVE